MPAYNAAKTLEKTYVEVVDQGMVDIIIIVDDASGDKTVEIARKLPNTIVHTHSKNLGYGANQKTCYQIAMETDADMVVMLHPDYQYSPKLIPAMVTLIGNGLYHCVLGSRILGGYALKSGMPAWKYIANRMLTFLENIIVGGKLSEYHTGYRAFSRELLMKIPMANNSNDFVFDNQMLAQVLWLGYRVAEISCPTRYFPEASSIDFPRSMKYGIGCIMTGLLFRLTKMNIIDCRLFPKAFPKGEIGK